VSSLPRNWWSSLSGNAKQALGRGPSNRAKIKSEKRTLPPICPPNLAKERSWRERGSPPLRTFFVPGTWGELAEHGGTGTNPEEGRGWENATSRKGVLGHSKPVHP